MPFVTPPFGMTNWIAEIRQNKLFGRLLYYADTTIVRLHGNASASHPDGRLRLRDPDPEIGSTKTSPADRKLAFIHADEIARPDYYSVWMNAGGSRRIRTEMMATERCAHLRFTFPCQ
jgi:hypothetical protein